VVVVVAVVVVVDVIVVEPAAALVVVVATNNLTGKTILSLAFRHFLPLLTTPSATTVVV